MPKTYDVLFRVSNAKLGTVLSTLGGEAQLVSVTETVEETAAVTHRQVRYVNGKRLKGISGRDLVLEILATAHRAFSLSEIGREMEKRGFSPSSNSPVLSALVSENKVRNLGNSMYCLPGVGVTVHKGAGQ